VKIGKQVWMGENLNYQMDNSWCYYNIDSNCKKYGRLYNWGAAMGACPVGWHLPTRKEWSDLVTFSGGKDSAGAKLKSKPPDWSGADHYRFSAIQGGIRYTDGYFANLGLQGYWWTATPAQGGISDAYYWNMNSFNSYDVGESYDGKSNGYSVRCLKGEKPDEKESAEDKQKAKHAGAFTDERDGKTYRTVEINDKIWMAENLNYQIPDSSWCYNHEAFICKRYGRLYNWGAAMNACPAGWHLPTFKEWMDLVNFVGGKDSAGLKLKSQLLDWNGTDDFGFSAMPGGYYQAYGLPALSNDAGGTPDSSFYEFRSRGYWWTATQTSDLRAYYIFMLRTSSSHKSNDPSVNAHTETKSDGFSVRCLRD
jgi:uncharacterized protein (TIGR02145 family)